MGDSSSEPKKLSITQFSLSNVTWKNITLSVNSLVCVLKFKVRFIVMVRGGYVMYV